MILTLKKLKKESKEDFAIRCFDAQYKDWENGSTVTILFINQNKFQYEVTK